MGKNVAAGVAGVFIAFGLVWLVEMIGHSVYPPPADIDFSDTEAMWTYVAGLPLGALLFVAGAWSIGAFAGTIAACRIGTANPKIFAMVVGGMVLVATAFNLVMIPHPMWFSISGVIGIIVAAWLGMTLSQRKDSAG